MNGSPQMTSLSDVVALKRIDMEGIERRRRNYLPLTPRVVSWNINTERPNTYFPNINRTYVTDKTYTPDTAHRKSFHPNIVNRESSWSPYDTQMRPFYKRVEEDEPEAGDETQEINYEDEEWRRPSITDAMRHPDIRICKPLGLLRREYKHPLSMYEDAISSMYSRYLKLNPMMKDPIAPQPRVRKSAASLYYLDRPATAGKEWVTNRWRLWSGGSASSPTF